MPVVRANSSQLVSWTQQMTQPLWLGQIGHVIGLKYSWSCPGGPNQLSAILQVEADIRTPATDPGRILQLIRGSGIIWEGIMAEPAYTDAGCTISANGAGNYGTDYAAYYTDAWPSGEPDEAVNAAISRGLRWVNPGIGTAGMYLGSPSDPAAQTITSMLNQVTSYGAYTWYVTSGDYGNVLSVFPLPVTPARLLVASTPVTRNIGADTNTIFERYVISPDNVSTGAAQVNGTTSNQNADLAARYGTREAYIDLTQAGTMSAAAAQAVGSSILQRYIHASWAAPFTASPGQLLTMGGQPVDLGADQAGIVCQLLLTDYAYGGEVSLAQPVSFLIGGYEYDDDTQQATITPFQYLGTSITDLLSAAAQILPAAASKTG